LALVFFDTGAWVALADPHDQFRSVARSYFQSIGRDTQLITSNYVIQEAVTYLVYHGSRRHVRPMREMLGASESLGWLSTVWVSSEIHDAAWRVFDQFGDQELSFVDCSSIAICRLLNIDTAFGFDRHFPIAGINRVPIF
jgi:predicted nucleic acid-binding protein